MHRAVYMALKYCLCFIQNLFILRQFRSINNFKKTISSTSYNNCFISTLLACLWLIKEEWSVGELLAESHKVLR